MRSDSTYALNIASGTWEAKANQELARRVSSLWKEVSGLSCLVVSMCMLTPVIGE